MKKALGKFLLILLAMSFISSFIPATAFAKSGEDADLKSIEVSCGVLDPKFDGSKTKYTLYIPSDLTQLVITPTPKSENAKANKINLLTFLLFLTYDSIFSDTIMYNSDEILLLTPLINIAFLPIYVTIHLFAELPNLQHCYCFAQKK